MINAQINRNEVELTRNNTNEKSCTIVLLMVIFVENKTKNHPFPLK